MPSYDATLLDLARRHLAFEGLTRLERRWLMDILAYAKAHGSLTRALRAHIEMIVSCHAEEIAL
jgi:hypothetical protein